MSGTTITLQYPVTVDGTEVTTLAMRRPKVHDSRDAQRGGGTNADSEIRLFANLCEVTPATIEEIDMADYVRMQKVYERFFVRLSPAAIRQVMALVAHVLHTPISEMDEMTVDELMGWADEARAILRATYGGRR